MKDDSIGNALKAYRKRCGMTVQDVAVALQNEYDLTVAEKTIYGWESNQANPPASTFLALCDIYQIERIHDIIQKRTQGFVITPDERKVIEQYRKQPAFQEAVKRLLGITH